MLDLFIRSSVVTVLITYTNKLLSDPNLLRCEEDPEEASDGWRPYGGGTNALPTPPTAAVAVLWE